jgi:hypothetical protein
VSVDYTGVVARDLRPPHRDHARRAAILHDDTRNDVQYVFGDDIRRLTQDDRGVELGVRARRTPPR